MTSEKLKLENHMLKTKKCYNSLIHPSYSMHGLANGTENLLCSQSSFISSQEI